MKKLFTNKGDQTSLNDFHLNLENPLVPIAYDYIKDWTKLYTATYKILNTNLDYMNLTYP